MSFLSRFSPVPSFPAYTGPYDVGSRDVEIPTAELSSSTAPPRPDVTTISFRLFYPCQKEKKPKPVYWLPDPQSEYLKAYYQFAQAKPWLASLLTWVPFLRLIQYTTIPATKDAKLLAPPNERWPLMIFSHGLGGSRNAYSHICGSLASHGIVVVAPDHRDGSAPISFLRDGKGKPKIIESISYPHKPTPETEKGRNDQLKIRCWELGLIHDALLKIEAGKPLTNTQSHGDLDDLKSRLDHRPGRISWAGHSFGATTVVQLLKSTYHRGSILFQPSKALSEQVTPTSPTTLLDLWAMPLTGLSTKSLYEQPLPAACGTPSSSPLAILSIGFYKWSENFRHTLTTLGAKSKPYIFYPISSAHLSQSDFGVLFPWITKKAMKADEPERTLRLNVRAILESLRRSGIIVADTSVIDQENEADQGEKLPDGVLGQDQRILEADGNVRGWVVLDIAKEMSRLGMAKAKEQVNGHHDRHANGDANGSVITPRDTIMRNEVMR